MAWFHRILGFGVVFGLLAVFLYGIGLRIAKKDEAPNSFWVLQHYVENLLIVQVVVGLVLFLFLGRRVAGGDLIFLHYFYGSLFPAIAIISGRISGLRREEREYLGPTWGAMFAAGLATRALMTGLGWGV